MSVLDDAFDAEADNTIRACLNLEEPKSFFLYAGAGSGKTRSLVNAVKEVCTKQGRRLTLTGQKIGIITYTNAACDEIKQRLQFDPRVEVSTIHAFSWSLISGYNSDIRLWVAKKLLEDIEKLEIEQSKARSATSQTSIDRIRSIESKRRRHANLDSITHFIYSPTGDNRTWDALSHAEVIEMTAEFLKTKVGLRSLLVSRFPILLVDESQDTTKRLMEALLDVEAGNQGKFCLGLFGDTMQRIYADGKTGLAEAIPATWEKPRKRMNHRCPKRVVRLINTIRAGEDNEEQQARSDALDGLVRLFIVRQELGATGEVEARAAAKMAQLTGDGEWTAGGDGIKTLALEHAMSARRFQFEEFFTPLYSVKGIRTSFLQGSGAAVGFFTREVLPLVVALRAADPFAVTAVVRKTSPLLDRKALEVAGENQREILKRAKAATEGLLKLVSTATPATARDVLRYVAESQLFTVPDVLLPLVAEDAEPSGEDSEAEGLEDSADDPKSELGAWRLALNAPFDQIEKYDRYVRGLSKFDTHQGVKGLEFPRVMVVLNDEEAGGFLFAYNKLFGTKEKSKTDLQNEADGKDTTIGRTRRLFYVTCSRAEKSLAVVYYTDSPVTARQHAIDRGWFDATEIEVIQ